MKNRSVDDLIDGPTHGAVRDRLRLIGPVVVCIGLILCVIGFGSFFATFSDPSSGPPRYFWCLFLGMPVLYVGGMLSMAGFGARVQRYMAGEMAPVAKDTFNYLSHGTRNGVQELAEAVGSGLVAGLSTAAEHGSATCPGCGAAASAGARFCPACGVSLAAETCPSCGATTGPGARFCQHCGAVMRTETVA